METKTVCGNALKVIKDCSDLINETDTSLNSAHEVWDYISKHLLPALDAVLDTFEETSEEEEKK